MLNQNQKIIAMAEEKTNVFRITVISMQQIDKRRCILQTLLERKYIV